MPEKVILELERWKGLSSEELGLTAPDLKITTHRYENQWGQQFNVLVVDARKSDSDPTIITSTSFDYRIDELLENRMAILATRSDARVIVSETPGITMDRNDPFHTKGAWQTPRQTTLAFSGNLDPLALEQLRAIDSVVGLDEYAELQFFGESFSADAVVAMARVIAQRKFDKGIRITRMDLNEPVNAYGNYTIFRQAMMLRSLATREDRLLHVYLNENTLIGHGEVSAFEKQPNINKRADRYVKHRQIPATYLSGAGLRKGLHTALKDALSNVDSDGPHLRDAPIVIARGIDSSVSLEKDLISAADTIRDNGGQAKTISLEAPVGDKTLIAHHVTSSFARFASYTDARVQSLKEN
ncbi:MAG: hypothetical protein JWN12_778 [Candidatus Saccharibacteria bacterium]|nr:hypothetical protein [Candidatus Saccharibacteria bacterium]